MQNTDMPQRYLQLLEPIGRRSPVEEKQCFVRHDVGVNDKFGECLPTKTHLEHAILHRFCDSGENAAIS
jgi:hypothetical protein